MDIPDHIWQQIQAMVQAKFDNALLDIEQEIQAMAEEYATKFIDVTDINDDGRKLMHTATGRVVTIKVEMS